MHGDGLTAVLCNGILHGICYVVLLLLESLFHSFLLLFKSGLQLLLDRIVEPHTGSRHAC